MAADCVGDLGAVFRSEWSKVLATLVRDLGDLTLAEDATQEAFAVAAQQWTADAWPTSPGAWLVQAARNKAIDQRRRKQRFTQRLPDLVLRSAEGGELADATTGGLVDDQLALIFGCCHPALAPEGQVALTLRVVAGLSTAQIARAFLVSESTMTRRITRAKRKITDANISFRAEGFRADRNKLANRVASVCAVIYSIYTEGHASATDAALVRGDLCEEALWLVGLVDELVSDAPEVKGLLALLLLSDARRAARLSAGGSLVLLPQQDRGLWDQTKIARGLAALGMAHASGRLGPYQMQAAIAALHVTAPSFDETDWERIIDVYDAMLTDQSDAVIFLNRAAAIGHGRGPSAGLTALDELSSEHARRLSDYAYFHACRAEFLSETGRQHDARIAWERARSLTRNDAERNLLSARIDLVS